MSLTVQEVQDFDRATAGCLVLQEMEHILEHIRSSRVNTNTQTDDFDHDQGSAQPDQSAVPEAAGSEEAQDRQTRQPTKIQTMVFSATLTLPQRLRNRFKKGVLQRRLLLLLLPAAAAAALDVRFCSVSQIRHRVDSKCGVRKSDRMCFHFKLRWQ